MIRRLTIAAILATVGILATLPAYATHSTEGTVSATVTPGVFAVTVTGTPAYGTVALSSTNVEPTGQTCSSTTGPAFNASNTGTVPSDYLIKGADSAAWTLEATAGNNQYVHRFATNPTTCTFAALDTTNTALATVNNGNSIDVYLNFDAPTDTSSTSAQTLDVTVVATASP